MLKHVLVKPLPFLFICTIKMINWLRKPNSIPKYRKGQRIRESKPAIGGVRSRDIRGNNKFKKGDFGLREAKASTTHLQYLRAKQANNQHFEVRRYIADKILNDRKLADAYKSLVTIHDTYG